MTVIVETIDNVFIALRTGFYQSDDNKLANDFREIHRRVVEGDEDIYFRIMDPEEGPTIEDFGEGIPPCVRYQVKVWFSDSEENREDESNASIVIDNVCLEIVPPEEYWRPERISSYYEGAPVYAVGLPQDEDRVFKLDSSYYNDDYITDDVEEHTEWFIDYRVNTKTLPLDTVPSVNLFLEPIYNDNEQKAIGDFKKLYDRANKENCCLYVLLGEEGPYIDELGPGYPAIVRYPVKVQLGRSGDKAEEIIDAMLRVHVPQSNWDPRKGYTDRIGVPIMNVFLKRVEENKIVLNPKYLEEQYYEPSEAKDGGYQDWYMLYSVEVSEARPAERLG